MPEFNKRVNVQGLRRAERSFRDYVGKRLRAEGTVKVLLQDALSAERAVKAANRALAQEAARG